MSLTDSQVKSAKSKEKDYKLRDRDNMYLAVTKAGGKYWRMDYRFEKKRKTLSIGKYPDLSLKDARSKCSQARDDISSGIDPSLKKKTPVHYDAGEKTFQEVAGEWLKVRMSTKSEGHQSRAKRLLDNEIYPYLGQKRISVIKTPEILSVLRKIEERKIYETVHRTKQTINQVYSYAISCGYAEHNPAFILSDALHPKVRQHYPSITDPQGVGRLMTAIDAYTGTINVRTALKLSALFFLRPGELRHLEWDDVDFTESLILIPAERMKMKMDHLIPLSKQATHLLQQLNKITGHGKYIFPSQRGSSRPLSENGVRTALRTLGYDNQTIVPHGFRAMARTLLDEQLEFNIVWIEQQLAHVVKDANGRAYNRTKHLRQRREMMQKWADYLDELKAKASGQNLVSIA